MIKNPVILWIVLSFAAWVIGGIWNFFYPANMIPIFLISCGQLSSLLAVGYYSTPSRSVYGKIAFAFVVVTVVGIVMKVLHLTGANEIIVFGLLGIFITYCVMWLRRRKS